MTCFFFYFILILHSALRTIHSSPVAHHWPEILANHGVWRLLPIALLMGCRHPNPAYRRQPHTMGKCTYAWFGNVLHNTTYIVYTAPLLIVPSIILFSIPNDPIMSSTVVIVVAAPSASLRAFKDSHYLSVKSRTAATAVLF